MTSTATATTKAWTNRWAFDFDAPDVRRSIERLQSRGADDQTIRLCLGMSALDEIINENRGRKNHVFFASFPKSGTTYLHKLLLNATGFEDYLLDRFSEDQQQNIIRQWMPMFLAQNTVTQIHMFATAPNIRMMKELGVRPVVLIRDLADVLVSLRDHVVNEDHVMPIAQFPREFLDWNTEQQGWFIVRMAAPWYLNFYASWKRAEPQIDVLWVRYSELILDPRQTLNRILLHSGVDVNPDNIDRAVASVDMSRVRFNVGVSGRGRKTLSDAQVRAIDEIAATFAGAIDFTPIGVGGR